MKILVTGANGMLARSVKERFKDEELILTDVGELDITDREAVENCVKNVKPDVIINCAAYTAVDKAEEDYDRAFAINATGPKNLATVSCNEDCLLVHISTDYVFGGSLSTDQYYSENDGKTPETVYGITKLRGEEEIMYHANRYYIFRTAWLYGDGPNFVRTMMNLGRERDEVKVVYDQHGSPTFADDLADIIYQAIEKKIPVGIYNATNLGFTTWYDFTKKIYETAKIDCKVLPVTSEEFVRPAKRPKNSMMSKQKLMEAGVEIPFWEDALERYIAKEKNE